VTGAGDRPLQLGAFDDVDASAEPARYVEWMESQLRPTRDRVLDWLAVGDDDPVLDVGCGPGLELRALSEAAGLGVGIDRSATMTAAAVVNAPSAVVGRADAQRLPFAAGSFAACHARAVLVHVPEPARAVAEMARCLRPGGRLALSEPDQGTHVVATNLVDVFERVKRHRQTTFRHPLVGRSLPALVHDAGLAVLGTWATPIVYTSLATGRAAGGPLDRAVADAVSDGVITSDEGTAYLDSLVAADAGGSFVFAALAFTVVARRPPT
jgi:SAM-dependent methyltransferase